MLSMHSRDTLWLLVDRRLSAKGRRPIDDAVKIMDLTAVDGRGLLAYAGLGATLRGTQPSEWMTAVLRGRGNLTFEQALGVLSSAANRELPKHIASLPGAAHFIVAPAFIRDIGARLYCIANAVHHTTGEHLHRYTRFEVPTKQGTRSQNVALSGTGGEYLYRRIELWRRNLQSLLKAHDRGKVSAYLIADQLARLNHEAHHGVRDGSVGPRCIVIWRRRLDARRPGSGGAHQFYTGIERDVRSPEIPSIHHGMDLRPVFQVIMKQFGRQRAEGVPVRERKLDMSQVNRELATFPEGPDERLR